MAFDSAAYQLQYRQNNREKNRLYAIAYRKRNKELIIKKRAEFYKLNTSKRIKATIDWQKNNPGKVNAKNKAYKLSKLNRTPKWLTKEHKVEIEEIYTLANELSWLSLDKLEVDHIIPLRGEIVSGLHVPWNLQIIPGSENNKKNNKFKGLQ